MITPAGNAGGVIKMVHQEFDDGYIIGFFDGCDYVPIVFGWNDIYDCPEEAVLASGDLYHNRLIRKDGGLIVEEHNSRILFDWNEMEKVISGYSETPSGELLENYRYELNTSTDTAIYGADGTTNTYKHLDRFYWTPGHITQNDSGQNDIFSATQMAHDACKDSDGCVNEWSKEPSDCWIIDNGEI